MSEGLPSGVLVSAVLRRVNHAGGIATVLARGESSAGAILVLALERGANPRFFERGLGADGRLQLIGSGPTTPGDTHTMEDYWRRRRARDPDLWVIELDIPDAERFAAETISGD